MNKVFKVIWSEARNAYVVVSEMAKSHGTKSCSTKKLLAMLIATGVMTCASVAPAMAANPAPTDTKIEVGNGASASGQGSVAIGNNAQASGLVGIAIGRDAVASGTDSIAIGSSTKADQTYSVAVGNDIGFTAYAGTAVGQQAYASGDNATAIGTMTNVDADYNASHGDWRKAGAQSTAIGAYAGSWGLASTAVGGFSKAEGKLATAIGYNSQANVDYGTALCDYSEVTAGWGVAIGASSVADRESGVIGAFAPEGADSLTWRANGGAVSVGSATLTRQITNVAAGTADTDAVNVAQLKAATENTGWHLSAEEKITGDINSRTKINHGDTVHFQGTDDNITISKEETEDATVMHVALSRNLVIDSVNAGDYFMDSYRGIGVGRDAYITEDGLNANDKVITNVAVGTADTDAVNVSQLNKVSVEAGKHSVVTEGANITVTPEQAEDGRMQYNVALNNDILLSGDNDAFVNISGSNGSVWASSSVAAGNVIMDGTTATVSGLGNTTTAYDGFANGEGKAATEEQLKEISKVADNANQGWNLSTNGGEASKVAPGETVDISGDKNIKISNDGTNVKVKLNENIDVNSVQTNALNSKYNLSVGTMAENGIMPFFVNSTGDFYAAHNKFHVDKDGKVTATAGEIGNVVLQNGVYTGHSALRDGELFVGDASGNYSQITTKGAKLGKVTVAVDGKISGVAAGAITADSTDAVNGSQLHAVATEAGKHSKVVNGNNTNVEETTVDGQKVYKVNLNNNIMVGDVTGKYVSISGTNGTIETTGYIATKDRVYADKGAKLADIDVTGDTISNGDAKLALNGAAGTAGMINGKGASVYMQDGYTVINSKVAFDQNGKISGVAAGTADTDAVNVSQLKAVGATANMGWNLATNGVATEATNVKPGDYVDFSGDKNISVSHDGTKVKVELNKDLVGIESISNGDAKMALNGAAGTAGMINGKGASIYMQDGYTVINSKVAFDQNGKISGVAAGAITADSTDAVNGSQLHAVATEAGKHSKVVNGSNINVEEFDNDGQKIYKVNLNKDIMLGDLTGKNVSISGTNGTIETTGYIATKDRVYADKGAKLADIDVTGDTISNGDAKMALNGAAGTAGMINGKGASIYMQDGYTVINSKVAFDQNGKISGVAAGAITADSTDAVNGSQLHAVATEAGKHSKVVNGSNINVEEFDNDGQKIYKVNLNKDIMLGDLTGKNVSISGTNGTIETTGYIATQDRVYADKGGKLADIDVTGNKISNGASSIVLDGSNVKVNDKVTIDQNGKISGVAAGEISSTSTDAINGSQLKETNDRVTKNEQDIAQNKADIAALDNRVTQNEADIAANRADIDKNKADIAANRTDIDKNAADIAQNKTDIKNLDNRVTNVEELAKKHTTVTQGDNITVTEGLNADGGKEYNVALNKDINLDSVTTGQTVMNNDGLKVGKDVSVTATAVTAGKTSISDEGVKVGDKTYISDKGLNANDQKVTNVAAGEISATSKDAVNGSQLYKTNQEVANNTNRINQLGSRVNKVGAGAAALAALHPMDFDPDDKLTFSAGYGNYGGENAAAIGAYYRPDEKVMFSVGGTVGNGENMVNAGVSFSLDRTNHVSNSRTALAREVIDLRGQLAVMGAKMAKMEKAFGMLDETKTKLFPDIPANHWAYEYIAKLAGNGYIEGYPDGNFGGDRLMTRYEFAAMLYRAIENGAALEEKIIKEFEPELGRIRVDRISGEDGDRDKIERVRVNDTKGERDHYGNKLAK